MGPYFEWRRYVGTDVIYVNPYLTHILTYVYKYPQIYFCIDEDGGLSTRMFRRLSLTESFEI